MGCQRACQLPNVVRVEHGAMHAPDNGFLDLTANQSTPGTKQPELPTVKGRGFDEEGREGKGFGMVALHRRYLRHQTGVTQHGAQAPTVNSEVMQADMIGKPAQQAPEKGTEQPAARTYGVKQNQACYRKPSLLQQTGGLKCSDATHGKACDIAGRGAQCFDLMDIA